MPYKNKQLRKEYYDKHKDEINRKRREYSNRPEVKKRTRESDIKWRRNNKEKIKKYNKIFSKTYRDKMKNLALDHYGRKCACCGEDNPMFLSIDHINGNGTKHRKLIWNHIATWLNKNNYPTGFQTLCFNCNWGKHINGGVCPHKNKNICKI